MATNEQIHGLVLTGGRSRRMGKDKALLRVGNETQLSRVVRLLSPFVDQVFVSTRADQRDERERGNYQQIVDRYEDLGPIAGILTAMEAHPDAGWLVLACDLPKVDADTIRHLLENRSFDQSFTAYRSSHDGLPEPLCAYYPARSSVIVKAFVDDGMICPRKLLIRSDTHLLELRNPAALDNVNTPEDLAGAAIEFAS